MHLNIVYDRSPHDFLTTCIQPIIKQFLYRSSKFLYSIRVSRILQENEEANSKKKVLKSFLGQ